VKIVIFKFDFDITQETIDKVGEIDEEVSCHMTIM